MVSRARRGGLATKRKYASVYTARAKYLGDKVPKTKAAKQSQARKFYRTLRQKEKYYPKNKKWHLKDRGDMGRLFFRKKHYRGFAAVLILMSKLGKGYKVWTIDEIQASDYDVTFGPNNDKFIVVEYNGTTWSGMKRIVSTSYMDSYDDASNALDEAIQSLSELPSVSEIVVLDKVFDVM